MFDLLKLDGKNEWLKCPPEVWSHFEAFDTANDFVKQLLVVNDIAERGIKVIGDFMHSTKSDKELECLAQTVEFHRSRFSGTNTRKESLQRNL